MFETGMSALVLKICSEYAKALGLNFPPCVQQEINAIAQYVDLHTVKDLKVEQDGNVVTITCYTEGEQEKVFTVMLPEVNVDVLFNLIKGSSSVVVDKSEDGTHLVVRLDKSQEFEVVDIGGSSKISNEQYELLIANPNSVLVFQGQTYYNGGVYQGDTNLLWYVCFSNYQYINMQELFIDKATRAITSNSTPLVKEYHVYITPDSATQGTLSQNELDGLMGNEYSYIVLNNELYRLADKGHTEGVWTYVHTGWDGTAIQDKSINITVSTRAWKQVVGTSGGKSYMHYINIVYSDETANNVVRYLTFSIYRTSADKLNNVQSLVNALGTNQIQICGMQTPNDNEYGIAMVQFYNPTNMSVIGINGKDSNFTLYDKTIHVAKIMEITDVPTSI